LASFPEIDRLEYFDLRTALQKNIAVAVAAAARNVGRTRLARTPVEPQMNAMMPLGDSHPASDESNRYPVDRSGGLKYIFQLSAITAVYFTIAKFGLVWASIHPSATPIWPPTGFALAAVLLFGYRVWPAIFIAAFMANATTAGSFYTSIAIAAGNTLESVAGSWLINRWSDGRATFDTPAGVAKFALISFAPTTMVSATVGVLSLTLAGFAVWSKFFSIWLTWWMGDLAGALVVAPAIVSECWVCQNSPMAGKCGDRCDLHGVRSGRCDRVQSCL